MVVENTYIKRLLEKLNSSQLHKLAMDIDRSRWSSAYVPRMQLASLGNPCTKQTLKIGQVVTISSRRCNHDRCFKWLSINLYLLIHKYADKAILISFFDTGCLHDNKHGDIEQAWDDGSRVNLHQFYQYILVN